MIRRSLRSDELNLGKVGPECGLSEGKDLSCYLLVGLVLELKHHIEGSADELMVAAEYGDAEQNLHDITLQFVVVLKFLFCLFGFFRFGLGCLGRGRS